MTPESPEEIQAYADMYISFLEQLDRMAVLAAITDARFDVGEVSFSNEHGVSVDTIELHKNSAHTYEHGLKSYTWPEDETLTYENPNNQRHYPSRRFGERP